MPVYHLEMRFWRSQDQEIRTRIGTFESQIGCVEAVAKYAGFWGEEGIERFSTDSPRQLRELDLEVWAVGCAEIAWYNLRLADGSAMAVTYHIIAENLTR